MVKMAKLPVKLPETDDGTIVFNQPVAFNEDGSLDLAALARTSPIIVKQPYSIDYIHSYGQDSPWFAALANGRLLGSDCTNDDCPACFPTPRAACMECGADTEWVDITERPAKVHTFTVCHFGSEAFLPECPFVLALIEFEGCTTLFLTRLMGVDPEEATLDWIGMQVKPKFRRLSKVSPTAVYFVPEEG